jgi:uncharacterized protein (TIGR00369 family)
LELEIDHHCFVCGPENPAGLHLHFHWGEGRAETRLLLRDAHQGYTGVAHGGIIGAVLDEVMVYAAVSRGHWVATAEMTVRYLKPVHLGQTYIVTGEVIRAQRRLIEAQSEVRDEGGALVASATAKLLQGRAVGDAERKALEARRDAAVRLEGVVREDASSGE